MPRERICYECAHCLLASGWGGTDVTPGSPAELACLKEHWDMRLDSLGSDADAEKLGKALEMARTCQDFEAAPWARARVQG